MSHTIEPSEKSEQTDAGQDRYGRLRNEAQSGEALNSAEPQKTPLEMAREQQAKMHSQEVTEQRVESADDIPATPSVRPPQASPAPDQLRGELTFDTR
jgi:hypothetical protein